MWATELSSCQGTTTKEDTTYSVKVGNRKYSMFIACDSHTVKNVIYNNITMVNDDKIYWKPILV